MPHLRVINAHYVEHTLPLGRDSRNGRHLKAGKFASRVHQPVRFQTPAARRSSTRPATAAALNLSRPKAPVAASYNGGGGAIYIPDWPRVPPRRWL